MTLIVPHQIIMYDINTAVHSYTLCTLPIQQ